MEKEKETFIIWVKKHKSELIIAGISVTAILLKKLVEKTPKEILAVSGSQVPEMMFILDAAVTDMTHQEQIKYAVREHIRNLPESWKASPEKIARAAEKGYAPKQGQTLVDEYTRGRTAT